MRLERLKSFALALPQTKVVSQWGGLVFKVMDKAFFMISLDGETIIGVIFKCTPEEFAELIEIDGIGQAPYFAKRMWVRVEDLANLSEQDLNNRIRHSYDLVVAKLPKKLQAMLKYPKPQAGVSSQTAAVRPTVSLNLVLRPKHKI